MPNDHIETGASGPIAALRARVDTLYLEYIFPVLATLRIGEAPEAVEQEEKLLAAAKIAGIRVRRYIMPADLSAADAEELIREINADVLLSALLLIRPLPSALDADRLEERLRPEKRISDPVPAGEDPILTLLTRVADAAERRAG